MKVLLPLSGGLDSTAALFMLVENGHSVKPITLDYDQKCGVEIERAARIARFVNTTISTETIMGKFPKCSRIDPEIQLPFCSNATEASVECAVPGLYPQIISSSIKHAILNKCSAICLPFSIASSQFYPEFDEIGWRISSSMIKQFSSGAIKLILPFHAASKLTILKMLFASGAPYWMTHSCLENEADCGSCPKCLIRKSVLDEAKSISPHHY